MDKKKGLLKKLILAIAVALGIAAAGYFGLDITEKEITDVLSPIVEDVFTEEEVPAEEVPAEEVPAEEVPAEEVPAEEVPAEEVVE